MKDSLKNLVRFLASRAVLILAFGPTFGYGLLAEQPVYPANNTINTSHTFGTADSDPSSAETAKQKKTADDGIKWCADPEEDECPSHE